MKAKKENLALQTSLQKPFLCYEITTDVFEFYWHFHPEYEMTFIARGQGKRLVGDSQELFAEGDLVLLGPNLPHCWVSDGVSTGPCQAFVIQFPADWADSLTKWPGLEAIKDLLDRSATGLHFPFIPETALFDAIRHSEGATALAHLLLLLDRLAAIRDAVPVASAHFNLHDSNPYERRINTVFQYVQENISGNIFMREAALRVHLSESAFCKFIKRATGNTFSAYVNNARIAHACALLLRTDMPVGQVAAACGFENLTYFNRVFKKRKGMTPGRWRRK